MNVKLKIWRQKNGNDEGRFVGYEVHNVSPDASFLEMLDILNVDLVKKGEDPIAFDHDCREGICGSCGMVINGRAHGPGRGTATCELRMRLFQDGDTIVAEPWRAKPFPVIKDLVVDRTALDRIMQAGGFISARTGAVPEANSIPVPKPVADEAMLFVSAKVSQFALLPQGQPERKERALRMVEQMDKEGFGNCSNNYACEAECPKKISVVHIARLNREFIRAELE